VCPRELVADGTKLAVVCDDVGNGASPRAFVLEDGSLHRLTTTGGYSAKLVPDGTALVYKDGDGQLRRLASSGARSRIDVPSFEGTWDLLFAGR